MAEAWRSTPSPAGSASRKVVPAVPVKRQRTVRQHHRDFGAFRQKTTDTGHRDGAAGARGGQQILARIRHSKQQFVVVAAGEAQP